MKKQNLLFCLCLCLVVLSGLRLGKATISSSTQAAAPGSAAVFAPTCTATVDNVKIQRNPGGNDFGVHWKFPSRCQQTTDTELTITKLSGAQRTDRKKKENGVEIANFSFLGDGDLNPVKKARATIKSSGVLAAKGTLTVNLGFSSGVGSNVPNANQTFALSGIVLNQETKAPLTGVKIEFQLPGLVGGGRTIAPVETDSQGRWSQSGFPVGRSVIVTASKRFFLIDPPSKTVSEPQILQFTGRSNAVGATPTPPPSGQTFTVSGKADVFNASTGVTSPLAGAVISFALTSIGQANVPGPVTTQSNGTWTQSGFTNGASYRATISKSGIVFGDPSRQFNSAAQGLNFLGRTQ